MRTFAFYINAVFIISLLLHLTGGNAMAGMMHIESYGLKEVRDAGGYAIKGLVTDTDFKENRIEVKIIKIWNFGKNMPRELVTGTSHWMDLHVEAKWDNPRKSPLVHRLWNSDNTPSPSKADEVYLIPHRGMSFGRYELMPSNAQSERKLDVYSSQETLNEYRQSSDRATLIRDASDRDLSPYAIPALIQRSLLSSSDVIASVDEPYPSRFMKEYYENLSASDRKIFLSDAVASVTGDNNKLIAVLRLTEDNLQAVYASQTAELAVMLDVSDQSELSYLRDFKYTISRTFEKSGYDPAVMEPFMGFMRKYAKHRTSDGIEDSDLKSYISHLSADSRKKFIIGVLEILSTSAPAVKLSRPAYDMSILNMIRKTVTEEPSADYLQPLAVIDPMYPYHKKSQSIVISMLAEMTIAIAQMGDTHEEVFKLLEPKIRNGLNPGTKMIERFRELTSSVEGDFMTKEESLQSEVTEISLMPGDFHYTMGGIRVALMVEGEGHVFSFMPRANRGVTHKIASGEDFYFEGIESVGNSSILYIADKTSKSPLTVDVIIKPGKESKELLTEPELMKLAQKIAEDKGFKKYKNHNYIRWEGVFEYTATGSGESERTFIISGYSGKVIKSSP